MGAPKPLKAGKRPRRDDDSAAADAPAEAAAAPAALRAAAAAPAAGAPGPPPPPPPRASPNHNTKKPKKGAASSSSTAYWSSVSGWKNVSVTDQEVFLGADEGGFGGLEELDPRDVDAAALAELDAQARALFGGGGGGEGGGAAVVAPGKGSSKDTAPPPPKKQQQQQQQQQRQQQQKQPQEREEGKGDGGAPPPDGAEQQAAGAASSRKERRAAERRAYQQERLRQRAEERRARRAEARAAREAGAVVGGGEVDALKARLAALERENARLKTTRQREGGGGSGSGDGDQDDDADDDDDDGDAAPPPTTAAQNAAAPVDTSAWRRAFPGGWLHPELERALGLAGFGAPTPVQVAAVPGAARDRRDVICAAQTGSGKTLAFGLPILQRLLEERDRRREKQEEEEAEEGDGEEEEEEDGGDDDGGTRSAPSKKLRALVLAPTRELGLQVAAHLSALAAPIGFRVAAVVGGLALPKQERLLARAPEVVVATPGRLWDLMRSAHPHVSDLSRLAFLVIDEADRMVQRGHYAELGGILDLVPRGGARKGGGGGGGGGGKGEGAPPAAAAAAAAAAAPGGGKNRVRLEDEEVPALEDPDVTMAHVGGGADGPGAPAPAAAAAPQTMVFSATLTLPAALRKRLRKGGGGQSGAATLDALMDRVPFRGAGGAGGRGPLVVDLTTARRLADRVHEAHVRCSTDARRDAALALFLSAHPGRCVVFVNAVSSLRRLAALLRLLGLPAQALHAQQQQRQRLKALDRFRASAQGVLVATDVAARGLDVKGVESVVHYQLPASADTYIHRCGRTARTGGGEGVSLALVTPQEAARWRALRFALGGAGGAGGSEAAAAGGDDEPAPCPEFPLDGRLLLEAERRLALAEKVDALERGARKRRAEAGWARSQAAAAGLALSDDGDDGGGEDCDDDDGGRNASSYLSSRDAAELARLRSQLAAAVAAPLQPAVSRRFFAGGGSADLLQRASAGGGDAAAGGEGSAVAATAAAADLAARLAANASAKTKSKTDGAAIGGASSKREHELRRREAEQQRQKRMDRLMLSNNERKRRRREAAQGTGRGMVVIGRPGVGGSSAAAMAAVASGRQVGGPSALAALRGAVSSG
jgi:ATP-dependent RNA helicase DDX24/MAK5